MNKKYFNLAIWTFLYFIAAYVFEIYFYSPDNNFFWCITPNFFDELNTYLPVHCDEGPYQLASQSLEYFFSERNPYQKRPLYIISIFTVRSVIEFLSFGILSEYLEFRLAMIVIQYFILYLIALNSAKFFKIEKFNIHGLSILFLIFSIPNIRWNLFFPSHGNITLLLMLFSLNKLKDVNSLKNQNMTSFFIFMGIASLFHRSSIFYGLIITLIVFFVYSKKFIEVFSYIFFMLLPTVIYELFYLITEYESFDWNKEIYGQFYWFLDLLIGRQNQYHNDTCQKIDTFLNCNFEISFYFINYFAGAIFLFTVLLFKNKKLIKDRNFQNILIISSFIFIFWSFQGLYPNFRFINYSIGYFLFLSIIYICSFYEKNILLCFSILIYEFSILYLEVYSITYFKPNVLTYLALSSFSLYIMVNNKILNNSE